MSRKRLRVIYNRYVPRETVILVDLTLPVATLVVSKEHEHDHPYLPAFLEAEMNTITLPCEHAPCFTIPDIMRRHP